MKPIHLALSNKLPLVVVPDTRAHLDGHAVITHTYSVFRDSGHNPEVNNRDYYGIITFEKPGHLFTYTAGEVLALETEEVSELIEKISHVRDNPTLWEQS